MPSCEKCWIDARGDAEQYERILTQRNTNSMECTPEQQAGPDAGQCPFCLRKTMHMYSDVCMVKACGDNAPPFI